MLVLTACALAQTNLDFSRARRDGRPALWDSDGPASVEGGALHLEHAASATVALWQNHVPARPRFRISARLRQEGEGRLWVGIETGDEASIPLGGVEARSSKSGKWHNVRSPWITLADAAAPVSVTVRFEGTGSAWVDDIVIFDREGPFPTVPLPSIVTHGWEDRLWTDAERVVDPLPAAVDPAFARWVATHHVPIRSLGATDISDLGFLKQELEDVRVVQLGESSHGGADYNALRHRMVRMLHEELGFDVLSFESSMVSCELANTELVEGRAEAAMRYCLYGVWWSDEVVRLFEYVASTQDTERPLRLAGFDAQSSGASNGERLAGLVRAVYAAHPERGTQLLALFDRQLALENEDDPTGRAALLSDLDAQLAWLDANLDSLGGDSRARRALLAFLRVQPRMIWHREPGRFAEGQRDLAMGELVVAIAEQVHPGEKVITWAHNFHVRYDGAAVHEGTPSHGAVVRKALQDKVFTIGMYTGTGSHGLNDGEVAAIAPAPDHSLEALLSQAGQRVHYVRLRGVTGQGTEWMDRPLHTWDFGQSTEVLVPRDQYDALIYIHEMSPPTPIE